MEVLRWAWVDSKGMKKVFLLLIKNSPELDVNLPEIETFIFETRKRAEEVIAEFLDESGKTENDGEFEIREILVTDKWSVDLNADNGSCSLGSVFDYYKKK